MNKDERTLHAFRAKLLKGMKRHKLTQKELADSTGTCRTELSRIMNGKDPRYTTALKLMKRVNNEEGD